MKKIDNLKTDEKLDEQLFEMEYEMDFKDINQKEEIDIVDENKPNEVEINGKTYTIIEETIDSLLVEVEIKDSKGIPKLQKQWFYKIKANR